MKPLRLLLPLLTSPLAVPAQSPMPDFSLPDVNSASLRRRVTALPVSPRDYLHQVTAWYFGREN